MKTETETETQKEFDTVVFFRKIKAQIATKLAGKSYQEQKMFIRQVLSGEIKLNIEI